MLDKDPFTEHVDAAHKALLKMIEHSGELGLDPGKLLESLFKHYTDRMLSDNERIWRTGALFVPISLAAFAALTAVKCLQVWQILVLGAPSIVKSLRLARAPSMLYPTMCVGSNGRSSRWSRAKLTPGDRPIRV